MDKLQELRFCRILFDSEREESAIWQALDTVYADGYVDNHEEALLEGIANNGDDGFPTPESAYVDAHTKSIVHELLSQKIFHKAPYQRFREANFVGASSEPTQSQISAALKDLQPTPNGAFRITLVICDRGFDKKLDFSLPDKGGQYPDGNYAGKRNPLDERLQKILASHVLSEAYENAPSDSERRILEQALEAVARMRNVPRSKEEFLGFGNAYCKMADVQGGTFDDVVGKRVEEMAQTTKTIQGIVFKGPFTPTLQTQLMQELAQYPDYVVQAWADLKISIFLFDPSVVYPALMEEGILRSAPTKSLSWTNPEKIYVDMTNIESIGHELFHALANTLPTYASPLLSWYGAGAGISLTHEKTKARVVNYPEEVFAAVYEDANVDEHIAVAPDIYYTGRGDSRSISSSRELQTEEPEMFLCMEILDEILRQRALSSDKTSILPVWAIYTETVRAFVQNYLKTYGDSWNEEGNLKIFRQSALQLDLTPETDFWKAREKFSAAYEEGGSQKNDITKDRYFEAAEKMAAISSNNEFFQNEATLARHQKNLRVGSSVPLLIETPGPVIDGRGPIVKVVANVSKITDRGMVVVFTCAGKKWEQEIFCTGEPVNLYYGADNSYIGTVYLDFTQE